MEYRYMYIQEGDMLDKTVFSLCDNSCATG